MADSSRRTGAAIEAHYRSVARLAADGHASADDESALIRDRLVLDLDQYPPRQARYFEIRGVDRRPANTGSFLMHSGSILAAAVLLSVTVPGLVSAAEVTSQPRSDRIVSSTGWVGFAVSPNQRVFKSEALTSETAARNAAKNECDTTTLRTCKAIAVTENADVSAVGCSFRGRSESFVAAQKGIALDKANQQGFADSSCVEFYTSGEGEGPAE